MIGADGDQRVQVLVGQPPRSGRIRDRVQDLFGGPLYLRGVILAQDFPPGYAERLTDAVLRSLGAKSSDRS
jgi:hypothetical protein